MPIRLKQIIEPWPVKCPCCGAEILRVATHEVEVVGEGYWLHDGDTIFGLLQRLSDEQRAKGYDYDVLVGRRPCCGRNYFVVQALFVDAVVEEGSEFEYRYLHQNDDPGPETNFVAHYDGPFVLNGAPKEWRVRQHDTPLGVLHCHMFGPFVLKDDSIIGEYGVAACIGGGHENPFQFGSDLLFGLWDDLRKLTAETGRETEVAA